MTPEQRIKAYGSPDKLPGQINLKAGQLNLVYENGCIRWIRLGNTEIIRMIYSAVRDRNWGTIEPTIESEIHEIGKDSFNIRIKVSYKSDPIHYIADYHISGGTNKIRFEMQGTAQSTFLKNRIGFCVLHPIVECAGKNAKVYHPDGGCSDFNFPEQIAANQPIQNIHSMQWNPIPGISAKLNFSGDIFEMEDQRNWTDASFKTYCTPLGLPFPAQIKKGESVFQEVELIIDADDIQKNSVNDFMFSWTADQISQLPEMGTSISSRKEIMSLKEIDLLKKLPVKHLRIELKPKHSGFRTAIGKASFESRLLVCPLFVVLYLSENFLSEYALFAELCNELKITVKYLLPVSENHLSFSAFDQLEPQIRLDFPGVQLGTGVNAYFAELNRTHPVIEKADFVSFTISPQVHAFDCATLVENLAAQAEVIRSTQILFPGKPVFISPISLKQRFNVVATTKEPESAQEILPVSVDLRQLSIFAASWTLGSLKYLSQAGTSLVTYYETIGWKGIIQGELQPDLPEKFRSKANDIFPVFYALKELSGFSEVVHSSSSHPLLFDGIVVKSESETKLFLFSFSSEELEITINPGIEPKVLSSLFYSTQPEYSGEKLRLRAWDLVQINMLS